MTSTEYLEELKLAIDRLTTEEIDKFVNLLYEAYINEKFIFIVGNGGSASTASHFSCDLAKTVGRFKVIPLTDNIALITALGNDEGYNKIFVGQIKNVISSRDILIAISGGGNSQSIIDAVIYANGVGAKTVGMTGLDGGILKNIVYLPIRVPSNFTQHTEDLHMIICHLVTARLMEILK